MGRKEPVVAVGESPAGQIAVVAFFLEPSEVLRPMQVYADEMTFVFLAEPIFYLRLDKP